MTGRRSRVGGLSCRAGIMRIVKLESGAIVPSIRL
jgi:hypothetical protein